MYTGTHYYTYTKITSTCSRTFTNYMALPCTVREVHFEKVNVWGEIVSKIPLPDGFLLY
jgi:hypothetical protein